MYEKLKKLKSKFETTNLWKKMVNCKEDSCWHREESVAVHTEMVLAELCLIPNVVDQKAFSLAYIACLFHDVGKPDSLVVKYKPERGNYNAFHGHELVSARMFEDYYMSNQQMFTDVLPIEDLYSVIWLIENHLPYDAIKVDKKMDYLKTAAVTMLGDHWKAFPYMLQADAFGRISDDSEEKRKKTLEFIEYLEIANVNPERHIEFDAPVVALLIGASGSGKSTCSKMLIDQGFAHYSFDDIRIKLAIENGVPVNDDPKKMYRDAFEYCDKHRSQFGHRADVEYIKLIKEYKSIVIDNTNTTRKNRAKFIEEAKKRGYAVVCFMFPIDKSALLSRMSERKDKYVPEDAILRQYNSISVPWGGVEVDDIYLMEPNFKRTNND